MCSLHLQKEWQVEKGARKKHVHFVSDISINVAKQVVDIWKSASLPHILLDKTVASKIRDYYDKYLALFSHYSRRIKGKNYKQNIDAFLADSNKLFDICSCKCLQFNRCTCLKDKKVPPKQREFLADQRDARVLKIYNARRNVNNNKEHYDAISSSNINKPSTSNSDINKPSTSKEAIASCSSFENFMACRSVVDSDNFADYEDNISSTSDTSNEFEKTGADFNTSQQNRTKLRNVALSADRLLFYI